MIDSIIQEFLSDTFFVDEVSVIFQDDFLLCLSCGSHLKTAVSYDSDSKQITLCHDCADFLEIAIRCQ